MEAIVIGLTVITAVILLFGVLLFAAFIIAALGAGMEEEARV